MLGPIVFMLLASLLVSRLLVESKAGHRARAATVPTVRRGHTGTQRHSPVCQHPATGCFGGYGTGGRA